MLRQNGSSVPAKLSKMDFVSIKMPLKVTWELEIATYLEKKKGTVKKARINGRRSTTDSPSK